MWDEKVQQNRLNSSFNCNIQLIGMKNEAAIGCSRQRAVCITWFTRSTSALKRIMIIWGWHARRVFTWSLSISHHLASRFQARDSQFSPTSQFSQNSQCMYSPWHTTCGSTCTLQYSDREKWPIGLLWQDEDLAINLLPLLNEPPLQREWSFWGMVVVYFHCHSSFIAQLCFILFSSICISSFFDSFLLLFYHSFWGETFSLFVSRGTWDWAIDKLLTRTVYI